MGTGEALDTIIDYVRTRDYILPAEVTRALKHLEKRAFSLRQKREALRAQREAKREKQRTCRHNFLKTMDGGVRCRICDYYVAPQEEKL